MHPITVSPTSLVLSPGQPVTLSASSTAADIDYHWTATAGTISASDDGSVVYTAPVHADSDVEIKVTSAADPVGEVIDVNVVSHFENQADFSNMCPHQLIVDQPYGDWFLLGGRPGCGGGPLTIGTSSYSPSNHYLLDVIAADTYGVLAPDGRLLLARTLVDACDYDGMVLNYWDSNGGLSSDFCSASYLLGKRVLSAVPGGNNELVVLRENSDGFSGFTVMIAAPPEHGAFRPISTKQYQDYEVHPVSVWSDANHNRLLVSGSLNDDQAGTLNDDAVFVKFHYQNMQSEHVFTIDLPGRQTSTAAIEDEGGNIIAGVLSFPETGGTATMSLYKLESETGDEIWSLDLGATGDRGITDIELAEDGTIYVAGQAREEGQSSELFVAAVDAEGNQLWREQFGETGLDMTASTDVFLYGDGELIVGGYARDPGPDASWADGFVLTLSRD